MNEKVMKKVTSTDEYTIFQRRDGRYAVKDNKGAAVNGDDKVKVLLEQGLVKAPAPKEPEPEPVEEAAAEEVGEEGDAETEAEAESEASADDAEAAKE